MYFCMLPPILFIALFSKESDGDIVMQKPANIKQGDYIHNKLYEISKSLKNTPYLNDPLGEGEEGEYDTDPLSRLDKFDCLTFVETVLALTFSETEEDFQKLLQQIRYKDNIISFETRLHFQNPDWILNNKKYVHNITNSLSNKLLGKKANISRIILDRAGWFNKTHSIEINIKEEEVKLDYITFADLQTNIEKLTAHINKPYIFMTVINPKGLKDKIGTDFNISHTGFIIKKEGELFIRHASSTYKRVLDESFSKYIERISKDKNLVGFSILELKL